MNGLRPPLTAPPGFAVRQSRSDSKECCRPALLFREGEFPWQTRKPIKNISSAGTTPLARLLSAVPDSVRPCRTYVELHIILLYFPAFCDTILILINFTAENSRWNINIFAKVFPAKSPQIHPTISEFAEWEWFQKPRNAWFYWVFEGSGPFVAIFIKRELTDFDSSVSSLFAFIVHSLLSCDPTFFDQTNENGRVE